MASVDAQALAQLKDIHLPDAIGWWPLAPGWYAIILLLFLGSFVIIFFLKRYYVRGLARREALKVVALYQQQYQNDANDKLAAARLSEILKRTALVYFPRKNVASLQGDAWIDFLNTAVKGMDFNRVRYELLTLPYQSTGSGDLSLLFQMAQRWIRKAHV